MQRQSLETLLQEEIKKINPDIPSAVFQFTQNRDQVEQYLKDHPSIPFVIRRSSQKDCFAICHRNANGVSHLLISATEEESVFKGARFVDGKIEITNTSLKYCIESFETQHREQLAKQWQEIKLQQASHVKKSAVLSIQTLDKEKVALNNDQVEYFAKKAGSEKTGDGHTGLALAKALGSPFAVLRSKENRKDQNQVIKNHVGNNSMIAVTGHGSPAGNVIQGRYGAPSNMIPDTEEEKEQKEKFDEQAKRGPYDIVDSLLEAGLKQGDHVTILLCICYGAKESQAGNDSFAHKLAQEFAKNGVSSTIIASDTVFLRFGHEVMKEDKLTFNATTGIDTKNVHVFSTKVTAPNMNPPILIYKPNETIQLAKAGMEFIVSAQPQATSTVAASAAIAPEKDKEKEKIHSKKKSSHGKDSIKYKKEKALSKIKANIKKIKEQLKHPEIKKLEQTLTNILATYIKNVKENKHLKQAGEIFKNDCQNIIQRCKEVQGQTDALDEIAKSISRAVKSINELFKSNQSSTMFASATEIKTKDKKEVKHDHIPRKK